MAFLLVHGADVYAQTSRGDNSLHIAARNGNAGCLHALLTFSPPSVVEDGPARLGDVVVQGDAGPTKFVDLHNGTRSGQASIIFELVVSIACICTRSLTAGHAHVIAHGCIQPVDDWMLV